MNHAKGGGVELLSAPGMGVLFVCTADICRLPAEKVFAQDTESGDSR
ncbi:MAG: hypothetical protein WAW75_04065 [Gallionella sp.]